MALQEAKQMGLDLLPDPETLSNAPRGMTTTGGNSTQAKYLYDNRQDVDDWGSTASESGHDDDDEDLLHHHRKDRKGDGNENENGQDDDRETGGLTDREIDRLDGKTSNRLGNQSSSTTAAATAGAGAPNQKYPERETGANTGPKGVLADQKYHQQQQNQERRSIHQAYNARMLAKAPTTTTFRQDEAREKKEKQALEGKNDEDDEDEKELERIRSKRLQDMRIGAGAGRGGATLGKKMFGSLMEMNAAQYVSAIDTEKKDVTVIIHIYSEFNPACKRLDRCLIQLAGRYATTKFIRIKSHEVDFDEEVCPTVLVYRAGDLIANLVMITYELSEEYDEIELEELFTKNKVISPHDQCQRENSFFERSLDMMSPMSSPVGELDMMSLGLGVGDGSTTSSSITMGTSTLSSSSFGGNAGGIRRGILSGNVKDFQYQDFDDDDDDNL